MRESLINRKWVLPEWKLTFEEVSNNAYKITLTDASRRQAGAKDTDLEIGIRKCAGYAFDIEKQISKSWNRFLLEAALSEWPADQIIGYGYDEAASGSWFIELQKERILGDGNRNLLIKQRRNEAGWEEVMTLQLKDLSYEEFLSVVRQIQ